MKNLIFNLSVVTLMLFTFNSCKKEISANGNSSSKSSSKLNGKWNLVRLSGGIMGVNEVHAAGEIVWTFNHQNSTVTVNNTVGSSSYYYLPSGTYNYQQISGSNQNYLVIDTQELGGFVISGNQLLIDENKKSIGEGACGFYFVLERD